MKVLITLLFTSSIVLADMHMPLDLTFEESQSWYKEIQKHSLKDNTLKEPYVQESIDGGEKMSNWLKLINSTRDENNQIRLTSKTTRSGIPIEKPSIYGPSTIERDFKKLKADMPKMLWDVFYGKTPISEKLPTTEEIFVEWARKTSRLYQTAVRWTGMKPYLTAYHARKAKDVRGYYYLKGLKDLDYQLQNIDTLAQSEQTKIKAALSGICNNSVKNEKVCENNLSRALNAKELVDFKNKYWSAAVSNWKSFFEISNPRSDVEWSQKSPNVMSVTFVDPENHEVAQWLKENVEDEFQRPLMNWNLEMNFVSKRPMAGTAYLEFQPNVTPHVSGGNKIVMDANTPLEEYSVKWTIRHEYGHILRIPDCYHEFYDRDNNVMINYQLDITDLMCSRAGDMNDRIFNELKDKYFKK